MRAREGFEPGAAARKAWDTIRKNRNIEPSKAKAVDEGQSSRSKEAFAKAHASEVASKEALRTLCDKKGWKLAFFEGKTGAPRNGIVDAVAFRLMPGSPDLLDLRLIQLKGGGAGASGAEIRRLKKAVEGVKPRFLLALYDGEEIHQLHADPATQI